MTTPPRPRVFVDAEVLFAGAASPSEHGASLVVLRMAEITLFSELIRRTGLDELRKPETREKIGGRIQLLHTVIQTGLLTLLSQAPEPKQSAQDAEA
jgi:hypothetical protein